MANIYLLYGEEKYDLNSKVEKIKKEFSNLEVGVNLFYVNLENLDELENITQSVTFFGSEKLIIIKDTKLKFNVDLLKDIDPDIKVIIIEDSVDKRTSEYKTLSKIAEVNEYKHPDEKQMITYISDILKKYGKKISYEDASYMQSVCGEDKSNIINELQKLVIYADDTDIIDKKMIDKICSKTLSAKIFDVLDDIIGRKKKQAISQLDNLLKQKESIIKIYIMLYKQYKQLYLSPILLLLCMILNE